MKFPATAAVIGLLLAPSAVRAGDMVMQRGKSATASAVGGASREAFAAAMTRMMSDMDVKPTGRPDEDFVLMMLPHHRGAVDMARIELRYGRDPALRRMAEGIVAAQEREIAEMRDWRAKHRP